MNAPRFFPLTAEKDLSRVTQFYAEAPDYWQSVQGAPPDVVTARAFFGDAPPGCDPADSLFLGCEISQRLSGIASVFVGFPSRSDAYIGLLLLGDWARGQGHGRAVLARLGVHARQHDCTRVVLAVLQSNPRAKAFWLREGFAQTGLQGTHAFGEKPHVLERLDRPL